MFFTLKIHQDFIMLYTISLGNRLGAGFLHMALSSSRNITVGQGIGVISFKNIWNLMTKANFRGTFSQNKLIKPIYILPNFNKSSLIWAEKRLSANSSTSIQKNANIVVYKIIKKSKVC